MIRGEIVNHITRTRVWKILNQKNVNIRRITFRKSVRVRTAVNNGYVNVL